MDKNDRIGAIVLLHTGLQGLRTKHAVILSPSDTDDHYLIADLTNDLETYTSSQFSVIIGPEDIEEGFLETKSLVRVANTSVVPASSFLGGPVVKLRVGKVKEILKAWSKVQTYAYYCAVHQPERNTQFEPGKSRIPYAGRVFDEREMFNLIDSSLDFWLTYGDYSRKFEKELANFLDVRFCALVNSGSSANLLAFMTLASPLLGDRMINRGDEVITVAAGFPTTIAPIVQYGAVPVFVDVTLETANIDVNQIEAALSPKTKAVILAHTLGNPFDLQAVKGFCDMHGLWLIEDNCDALGSTYQNRFTGTFGDLGTSSFYPPHHMTMGEGGAVYTNNPLLSKIMLSIRDWGRDCWCASGVDNTCSRRFSQQFGSLPFGYDHKYVYSHFGYNLKASDMQAAIGCAQLEKLPVFTQRRRQNFQRLLEGLKGLDEYLVLPSPTPQSDPSWFGFLITLKDGVPFSRRELVEHLEAQRIQTRCLFAGNITRHPCFDDLEEDKDYRIVGALANTDKILNNGFWLGVYPGMNSEMVNYMVAQICAFMRLNGQVLTVK